MRAAYELTVEFAGRFLAEIIRKPDVPQNKRQLHDLFSREITRWGGKTEWVKALRDNRGDFIHTTTAWPRVSVYSTDPLRVEVEWLKALRRITTIRLSA